ncbi:unnamed protein product [Fusarium graminearum]|nr:unnamed protein product [Fusarium graminearum]CAG1990136.1 unnamed protein product [Fusarium graminearum]CAG1992060.1 unnamed protein product [Fusarium graminearum]VTO89093.1 unnamed protein product [Fusarium graminearum]
MWTVCSKSRSPGSWSKTQANIQLQIVTWKSLVHFYRWGPYRDRYSFTQGLSSCESLGFKKEIVGFQR